MVLSCCSVVYVLYVRQSRYEHKVDNDDQQVEVDCTNARAIYRILNASLESEPRYIMLWFRAPR